MRVVIINFDNIDRFESSEMLATFLASTQLLNESWRLCNRVNSSSPPSLFIMEQIEDVGYVAFSGIQMGGGLEPSSRNLVALKSFSNGLFPDPWLNSEEGQEPVLVHSGLLNIFVSICSSQTFKDQVSYIYITWLKRYLDEIFKASDLYKYRMHLLHN